MADIPVPGTELIATDPGLRAAIPPAVADLMERLWAAGHAAYVVGGSIRDVLLGRPAVDWDLATDAVPDRTAEILPDSAYENRFGTVAVRVGDEEYQVTSFRSDHDYADYRRPGRVEFGTSLDADLARRDFTINAMAWGAPAGSRLDDAALVDRFGGLADLEAGTLRAVGDPRQRFEEDALRMVRAIRLATTLRFEIEASTLAAITENAALVEHLSGERVATELDKLLAADRPSAGFRLLAETGLLRRLLPELADQAGVPQNKVDDEDLWDHTLRTVDAAEDRPVLRLAALLHDVGKPATLADAFRGHEVVGAEMTGAILERLHDPRVVVDRVTRLVRLHMFAYEPSWSDGAVRRFIGRVGVDTLDDLLALREADNVGSGQPPETGGLHELRARLEAELAAGPVLDRSALAVDGDDVMAAFGVPPGPRLGRVLDQLLERVVDEPSLNDRATLLLMARELLAADR
jgi:putative nucleotidyltransferase with HDIG domain